jgi:hypothetical protein
MVLGCDFIEKFNVSFDKSNGKIRLDGGIQETIKVKQVVRDIDANVEKTCDYLLDYDNDLANLDVFDGLNRCVYDTRSNACDKFVFRFSYTRRFCVGV